MAYLHSKSQQKTLVMKTLETLFKEGETILLERDYDSKIWGIAGDDYDNTNPDHFPDGKTDRTAYTLSAREAEKLNGMIDGDGYISHVGIVITKKGIRTVSF